MKRFSKKGSNSLSHRQNIGEPITEKPAQLLLNSRNLHVIQSKVGLILFFFAFSLFSYFASGTLDSQDGLQYLAVSRHMYLYGEPTVPEYAYPEKNIHMNINKSANGKFYSPTGAGYSIAMLPAVFLSDVFHKIHNVQQPYFFPLESDWSVMLFASFTNIFFGSFLVVFMYHYLLLLGIEKKTAILFSLLTILATNLFPLAKHSFAHMMFITFLVGGFYGIKAYFLTRKWPYLFLAGICYGLVVISYNPVFVVAFPALCIYYLLQSKPRFTLNWLFAQGKRMLIGALGFIPFFIFYLGYNALRTGAAVNSGYGLPSSHNFISSQKILFEGVFGLLLSPGRGLLWYSPILLLLIIFWHKFPWRKFLPEVVSFVVLSVSYIYFYAIQSSAGEWFQWNGESSWGPRYIAVLLPFFILCIALIWKNLRKVHKVFIALPIIILSIASQSLGVLLPYQIKFHGLQAEFRLNGERFTTADYANFMPRYSPLIRMPRELAKRIYELPGTLNHGEYNVTFVDGVDFPFKLGNNQQWRRIWPQSFTTYQDQSDNSVRSIQLDFKNIQTASGSSYPVLIQSSVDAQKLGAITLEPDKEGSIQFSLNKDNGDHELLIEHQYVGTVSASTQQIYLTGMKMNSRQVSLRTLDIPYVQPLAQAMTQTEYRYFGKKETDPWFFWHKRSEMYEGTLDLWWLKGIYYSDLPKWLFVGMFVTNSVIFFVSGSLLIIILTLRVGLVDQVPDKVVPQSSLVGVPKSSTVSRRSGRKPGKSLR